MEKLRDYEIINETFLKHEHFKRILNYISNDKDLLLCYRLNYISIYYEGCVMFKIKPQSIELGGKLLLSSSGNSGDKYRERITAISSLSKPKRLIHSSSFTNKERFADDTINMIDDAKKIMTTYKKRSIPKERINAQKIMSNFKSIKNGIVIIDMEYNVEMSKSSKVDFIALSMKDNKPECIYLIEYKCTNAKNNGAGIKSHIKDFENIKNGPFFHERIKLSILETYKIHRNDSNINIQELAKNIEVKFAFLFTDEKEAYYTKEFKDKNNNLVYNSNDIDIYYWHKDNADFKEFGEPIKVK